MSQVRGMTCDDFDLLMVAGLPRFEMPEQVRGLMNLHESTCHRHEGEKYHAALLNIQVTPEMEAEAIKVIERLS